MAIENQYFEMFQEKLLSAGIDEDVARLYRYESQLNNVEVANALFGMVPGGIGGFLSGATAYQGVIQKGEAERLREKISDVFVRAAVEVKQSADFSDWKTSKPFVEFLHYVDDSMLGARQKSTFASMRETAHLDWQEKIKESDDVTARRILTEFDQAKENQAKYRAEQHKFAAEQADRQKKLVEAVEKVHQGQVELKGDLNQQLSQLKVFFEKQGFEFSDQVMALLQSDEALQKDLGVVLQHLERQQSEEVERLEAEQAAKINKALVNGFTFLSVLGEFTKNEDLQKIAMIGVQGVQIYSAVSQFSELSGLALLSPVSAIGMGVLSIASAFSKKSPSAHRLIMKQLQQISNRIAHLHKDMFAQFEGVHRHINYLEVVVIRHFQQLQYLIQAPVARKLDDIQAELHQLTDAVDTGFQHVLLQSLKQQLNWVYRLSSGVIPIGAVSQDKLLEVVVALSDWVLDASSNQHFTGMLLINAEIDEAVRLRVVPKKYAQVLGQAKEAGDLHAVIAPMLAFASQSGWIDPVLVDMPNIAIWQKSLFAYLQLLGMIKRKIKYDPKGAELNDIFKRAESYLRALRALSGSKAVMQGAKNKVITSLSALLVQHGALRNLREVGFGQWRVKDGVQATPGEFASSDYFQPKYSDHSFPVFRLFKKEEEVEKVICANVIKQSLKNVGLPMFDKLLLRAIELDLIELRCTVHYPLYGDGSSISGLAVVLFFKDTQEKIHLMRPERDDVAASKAAHFSEGDKQGHVERTLSGSTTVFPKNIRKAADMVSVMMDERFKEAKLPFDRELANLLLQNTSLLYQLQVSLRLAQLYGMVSYCQFDGSLVESLLRELDELIDACLAPEIEKNQQYVARFFSEIVPEYQRKFADAEISANLSAQQASVLQDVNAGFEALSEFKSGHLSVSVPTISGAKGAARFGLLANFSKLTAVSGAARQPSVRASFV